MADKKDEKVLVKVETKALLPINISGEMIQALGELYNPIFSNVRIYGNVIDPVFVAKDVEKLLQLSNLHYFGDDKDGRFEDGVDKKKIKIQTNGGPQIVIVLTEVGLYKAIFTSIAPIARQFQLFITATMRQLRTKGSVTINEALEEYKRDVEKKTKMLEGQLDDEHALMLKHKADEEKYYNRWLDMQYKAATMENKAKHASAKDTVAIDAQLQKMREKYMKPVYILLLKPPKELEDKHDYDYETEEPNEDDVLVYGISLKDESKTGQKVGVVYIHKDTTLDDVHKKLHEMTLAIKKKGGDFYANAYETSIEELQRIINTMMEL